MVVPATFIIFEFSMALLIAETTLKIFLNSNILGIDDFLQSYIERNSILNAEINIYCVICAHMGDFPNYCMYICALKCSFHAGVQKVLLILLTQYWIYLLYENTTVYKYRAN